MIKNINVDWDDISELKKFRNMLNNRCIELERSVSRKESASIIFSACQQIINQLDTNESGDHYVYAHCDPTENEISVKNSKHGLLVFAASIGLKHKPFYIGKGCGNRAFDLVRNETHRKMRQKIITLGADVEVSIVKSGMSEQSALDLENRLIDIFALKSIGGWLVNLDEGENKYSRRKNYIDQLCLIHDWYKKLS